MSLLGVLSCVLAATGGFTITRRISWTGYRKESNVPPNQRWTYFTDEEVRGLNEEFVAKLDLARKMAGIPFVITSGLRTPETNQSVVGAMPDSSHLVGLAVDLRVSDDPALFKVIMAAMSCGIHRIGVYFDRTAPQPRPTHVHLDDDRTKPPEVIWLKQEGTPV